MNKLNTFLSNDFVFSTRYRVWRHIIYWSLHIMIWAAFWIVMGAPTSYALQVLTMAMWIPVFILFGYPLVYGAIPHLLLKGKVSLFIFTVLSWGALGLYIDTTFRSYIVNPLQRAMGFDFILPDGPLAACYLCMTTSTISPMVIKFYKLVTVKQQDRMRTQHEKFVTELELLKAQVHPNFLVNALNNIYGSSKDNSPRTPGLILKISSLLSYLLYDCKAETVRMEKEFEAMKNYIDLESDRHGDRMDVSWSVEGNCADKQVSPLLMLPFLENAFKHGIAENVERPWLSVDVLVTSDTLRCKIANSKSEFSSYPGDGSDISNVKKRLDCIYPGRYELRLNDEGDFFVVSLMVKLTGDIKSFSISDGLEPATVRESYGVAMSAY